LYNSLNSYFQLKTKRVKFLPGEIILAIDPTTTRVALVSERVVAFRAPQALGMPRFVQNLQNESISNRKLAACTQWSIGT